MKKTNLRLATRLVFLGCLFLFTWIPLSAQAGNLLENPGFEAPYNTLEGDPQPQVAQGWAPWYTPAPENSPSFVNAQPEFLPTAPDTSRILEGANAQMMRAFYVTFDGGVYQRVTGINSGTNLNFSVSAYVWSSTYDEADLSELDGDVFFQVGIDPAGGTDAQSSSIVWSAAGVEQYDAYNVYSVEAQASGSAVTVFVRATIGQPVRNTQIYLDGASLEVAGSAPQQPSATNTNVATQTSTATSTATATNTSLPPTSTNTPEQAASATNTATQDNTLGQTATAIILAATETQSAVLTATANVPPTATATNTTAPTSTMTATATATLDTGLTATAIVAAATGTAQANLTATAAATKSSNPSPPINDTFPSTINHTVQPGETVSILAARYGSTI